MNPRLVHPPVRAGPGCRAAGAVRRAVAQDGNAGDGGPRDADRHHRQQRGDPLRIRPRVPRPHGAQGTQRRDRLAHAGRRRGDRAHPRVRIRGVVRAPLARRPPPPLDRRDRGRLLATGVRFRHRRRRRRATGIPRLRRRGRRRRGVRRRQSGVRPLRGGGPDRRCGDRDPPPGAVRPRRHPGRARRRDALGSRRALGGRLPLQLWHLLQPRRARAPGRDGAADLLESAG